MASPARGGYVLVWGRLWRHKASDPQFPGVGNGLRGWRVGMSTRTGFGRAVRRSSRRSAVSFFALLLLFSLGLGQGTGLIASAGGLGGSLSPASGGQKVTDLAKSSAKTSSTAVKPAAVTAAAGSL